MLEDSRDKVKYFSHITPGKVAMFFSAFGAVLLSFTACFLYTTYPIFACFDQIVLINKLLQLCHKCICVNDAEFIINLGTQLAASCAIGPDYDRLSQRVLVFSNSTNEPNLDRLPTGPQYDVFSCKSSRSQSPASSANCSDNQSCDHHAEKMNTNLVFVLMQYKIFVAQCMEVMRFAGPPLFVCVSLLMSLPFLLRLNLSYLNMFNNIDIAYFAAISGACLIPVNVALLPMCYFQSRCADLYRAMSSLMAHLTETKNSAHCRGLYNDHSKLILSKELEDSERFLDRFNTTFSIQGGKYTNLLRIHFWFGLIVITILFDTRSYKGGLLDLFFRDPLGVF